MTCPDKDQCYILNIYIDDMANPLIVKKYKNMINDRQNEIWDWISNGCGDSRYSGSKGTVLVDAGFDILCTKGQTITACSLSNKINHDVQCSMMFKNRFCGYYLFPRSSMGSKTPLRLSNSIGIIDAGYRGNIMSVVDNNDRENDYQLQAGQRITQICPPNMKYPIWPQLFLGKYEIDSTKRGENGFGSSGI